MSSEVQKQRRLLMLMMMPMMARPRTLCDVAPPRFLRQDLAGALGWKAQDPGRDCRAGC